jgi:hypothetical protein
MELTVMATSVAFSIGLGIAGTHLMMSMVFSLMTRSVARVQGVTAGRQWNRAR